ncbi:tRNA lysidine(34) synthetase TilS [Prochlorococcus marinus]|uniref:tRNA lysidine(34) synthetase TilS n=1 Tax=Prochlorococcus marinus TaxID=1219 RepID=UPI001ADAD466|nr:tRNA lysidine(34) synthetase TilS [Prochlorococcus marinus]MBO8205380.1 tRNA lysidine(34) synthetase TilS [Prochlorococcus marinus CUG1415]MBW3044640.1 tRNA lysidine(34) synthetase TilS [Prochlorococcus marinus str. MU1415]
MSDRDLTQKNWSSWHHLLHKEILSKKTLIPKGSNILISVSGGQDSMALLTLIDDLKKNHSWSISVWHGDHQWHEKSSLYAFELKSYCKDKNISFYFDKANKEDIFSEEKAREWRYKKLCERAKTLLNKNQPKNNVYLLTGHTSSDNAETFILNLSRGSNFAGLSNIASKKLIGNQFFLIRPLLIFSREDTKKFCNDMNIPVWEDPTNSDLKLKRNLVRKKIIPTLEGIYPGCSERINNFSQKMSNYNNERNDLSELAYLYCQDVKGIKRSLLNSMCIEARCTILNRFLKEISIKQYSSKNLAKLATSIYEKNKGQIHLQEFLKIVWNKNYVNFEKS